MAVLHWWHVLKSSISLASSTNHLLSAELFSEPLLDVEPEHVEDHLHLPVEFTGIYFGFYETKQVFKSELNNDIKAYS
jgi:hypothetical protein